MKLPYQSRHQDRPHLSELYFSFPATINSLSLLEFVREELQNLLVSLVKATYFLA